MNPPVEFGTGTVRVRSGSDARVARRTRTERVFSGPTWPTGGFVVMFCAQSDDPVPAAMPNGNVTIFGCRFERPWSTENANERSTAYSATTSVVAAMGSPVTASTYERTRSYFVGSGVSGVRG